ncbi:MULTISPECIES: hypothetical protein [unclassified Streptomyces]|uniref:hypothetical protein n=1 Tax=unclassified Streptomyces TaxID=2593676 RepID=UPI002DD87C31|nr:MULTISPECIES: hypothetical protein [unclassified Streptomyces]WSA94863.1 hypothetical protein OIE63_27340 [Streptomyces sp. NBC_01795]WSB79283.1 hypothetical protein OHB04_28460 [Streptomyces sp. NBC_01775]WSS12513.1 hypothetical protein OG533_11760 [Streptomyces sp. NBC_01186]WSS41299.1 hypothetical protein OG220_12305 [Streptomyces sp. NBC_01187]
MKISTPATADTGSAAEAEAGRGNGRPSPPSVWRQGLRWSRRLLAVLVSVCALLGTVRLAVPATTGTEGEPPGVLRQLTFLREELDDGAGESAQQMFPEGYFFLHALYGLSWVETGMRKPVGERSTALREARWALGRLDSPSGRAPFSRGLTPPYGVFHRGWSNWLRGGVLSLQPAGHRDPSEVRRFARDSAALGAAFDASKSPYLEAYPGQAWPVDSTVAMASLRLHDTLLPDRFAETVRRWLREVHRRLDPRTGLLPHRAAPDTGDPIEVARGSSQSLIQRFLVDIDPVFAGEQYLRFRDRYIASPLGLGPAVREYPDGMDGPGDVDSGPLPLGVSMPASVVTIGAAQIHGDAPLAGALANVSELAGLPIDTPWTKRYALGLAPIGDAFLVWSKTARPWVVKAPHPPPAQLPAWWRIPLLSLLAVLGAAPWLPALVRRYRRGTLPGWGKSSGRTGGSPDADYARSPRRTSARTPRKASSIPGEDHSAM